MSANAEAFYPYRRLREPRWSSIVVDESILTKLMISATPRISSADMSLVVFETI
jgi:hypothetical protein